MAKTIKVRIALACLAAFIPMGCTAAPKPASSHIEATEADPVATLSFSARSWGNVYENWSISRDGSGQYASAENARTPLSAARTFKGSPADFDAVLQDFVPLEQQIDKPLHCEQMWTDQDAIAVTWARQGVSTTLNLYLGCRSPTMTALQTALRQSRAHIAEMAASGKAR